MPIVQIESLCLMLMLIIVIVGVLQGTVLSSFFWGYATTQVIGGYMADRFGAETLISGAVVGWSVLTLVTPLIIQASSQSFVRYNAIICRVLVGCLQGK